MFRENRVDFLLCCEFQGTARFFDAGDLLWGQGGGIIIDHLDADLKRRVRGEVGRVIGQVLTAHLFLEFLHGHSFKSSLKDKRIRADCKFPRLNLARMAITGIM